MLSCPADITDYGCHSLDDGIPRASDTASLRHNPFDWLAHWRKRLGDVYALASVPSSLSRTRDGVGVVVAFGADNYRAVLCDTDRFRLPRSAAELLDLPKPLRTLNAGLHSMHGARHAQHKSALSRALVEAFSARTRGDVDAIVAEHCARWRRRPTVRLLAAMRALTKQVTARVLFGCTDAAVTPIDKLTSYFHLRRAATFCAQGEDPVLRAMLVQAGLDCDAALRRWFRRSDCAGVLARLAEDVDDDTFVAHANVLFISCYEPVAVALTWIILALSQQPILRAQLRAEPTPTTDTMRNNLHDHVIDEALRLLTPNALMLRVTAAPVRLGDFPLPAGCEVILCPFLAHRDPRVYSRPQLYWPKRWQAARPSPFDYLPFGGGGHTCIGRALALRTVGAVVATLNRQADVGLACDQEIDWCVHILLLPQTDPVVRMRSINNTTKGGVLTGGVARIARLR